MQLLSSAPWAAPLLGGLLIGLASWLLLAALGKVAGISGIASSALSGSTIDGAWRWAFLGGLITGGALFAFWLSPPIIAQRPLPLLIISGLFVGVGTVLGSGCTSGHGVCGLGRRSLRSLLATCVFMAAGMLIVFTMK